MRCDQVIAQRDGIIDTELALRMRIHQRGLIDVVLLQGTRSFDCQQLHIDVRTVDRRALLGQIAYISRRNTVLVRILFTYAKLPFYRLLRLIVATVSCLNYCCFQFR